MKKLDLCAFWIEILMVLFFVACDDDGSTSARSLDQKINATDMKASSTDASVDQNNQNSPKDAQVDAHTDAFLDQSLTDFLMDSSLSNDLDLFDLGIVDLGGHLSLDAMLVDQQIIDQMSSPDPCMILSQDINGQTLRGQALAEQLFRTLVQAYRPLTVENDLGGNPNRYTTARKKMFSEVYAVRNPQSQVLEDECVYTNQVAPIVADRGEPASDRLNCEHVFPREWMEQDRTTILFSHQESDLNNLAPSNPYANSSRGNLPYDVVTDIDGASAQFAPSKRGLNASRDSRFEPQDETKGDLARVVLYFSVRWGIPLTSQSANHQAQEILKQWHHADPVDAFEIERNQKVKALQGTFNPFIECPSFVDEIDFSNYTWALSNTDVMNLPNP
jgi:hypothetical protein